MTSRIKLWNLRLYIFTSTMHNFQTEKSRGFLLAKNSEALAYLPYTTTTLLPKRDYCGSCCKDKICANNGQL